MGAAFGNEERRKYLDCWRISILAQLLAPLAQKPRGAELLYAKAG
jgi:hypothetical protein